MPFRNKHESITEYISLMKANSPTMYEHFFFELQLLM